MPNVRVLVFASLTDHLGAAPRQVRVAGGDTVADLRRAMIDLAPAAAPTLQSCRVAINRAFATSESQQLADGDEVAFIPPVSGG